MRNKTGIAAFSDLRTPSSDGVRDAITVRPSASANFLIDSTDRAAGVSTDFTINKNQSLFNGFFNRIAMNEIVLDWGVPNISSYWENNTITITNPATAFSATVTVPTGFWKVTQILNFIAGNFNAQATTAGDPLRLEVVIPSPYGDVTGTVGLYSTNPANTMTIQTGVLALQLFDPNQLGVINIGFVAESPVLLGTRYIDFVCQQLTYNQDLKDNTTSPYNRDVIYRYYFAYDNVPVAYDSVVTQINAGDPTAPVPYPPTFAIHPLNVSILEGYTSFVIRRTPPVPKQIRWSPEQPVGQVSFQVYDDRGRLLDLTQITGARMEFQMSMLLSED